MTNPTTKVQASGTTLTVTVTACTEGAVTMQLSPDPGIQPSKQTSGDQVTWTWSGLPNNTYTLTVKCGDRVIDTTQVKIPT